jgi:AcrR family transcriptional regulator
MSEATMVDRPAGSLRARKKDRTRRTIQAEALRLFAARGFDATTIDEIAAAADVAPRTFFRYFPTKDEVVFWSEYQPMLAGFIGKRPPDEAAVTALHRGIVNGLAAFYGEERERLLGRITLAFRTPALHPRLRQQQAEWAVGLEQILADRLSASPDNLAVRTVAAATAAALFVAIDEWQFHDGREDLAGLIDETLAVVLANPVLTSNDPQRWGTSRNRKESRDG